MLAWPAGGAKYVRDVQAQENRQQTRKWAHDGETVRQGGIQSTSCTNSVTTSRSAPRLVCGCEEHLQEGDAPKLPAAAALRGHFHLSSHDTASSSYCYDERLDWPGRMPADWVPQTRTAFFLRVQATTPAPMQGADGLLSLENDRFLTKAHGPRRSGGNMMAETGHKTDSYCRSAKLAPIRKPLVKHTFPKRSNCQLEVLVALLLALQQGASVPTSLECTRALGHAPAYR